MYLRRSFALFSSLATFLLPATAEDALKSSSLAACQENSGFTASLFDITYTPKDGKLYINMIATSSIEGKVLFDVAISAYGYQITRITLDPCEGNIAGAAGLCPMTSGKMGYPMILDLPPGAADNIPGIAYTFPDLDAMVRVFVNMTDGPQAGTRVACVEANISNGKTVDLLGVKWATAAVAGLALMASAIISGLGYTNAASHVAANALSLFGYFQAQAMIGLCAVPLPPAVASWTQNFQWSMGIIKIGFVQDILTWYQRSTGGTPSVLFNNLHAVSVQVEKRSLPVMEYGLGLVSRAASKVVDSRVVRRAASALTKRANIQTEYGSYLVKGIQRVAFRATIESTNLFMTGLTFFYVFAVIASILVVLCKLGVEVAARLRWINSETFSDFRHGWLSVLKGMLHTPDALLYSSLIIADQPFIGILFRLTLIGFPQITILCMWEFTQVDSPAEVVLAAFFFFGMAGVLGWAAFKVIRMARRSVHMHRNPAYILFSDPQALNKWGFLYVQFRASAYYFIVPILCYIVVKGMFIALVQGNGTVQAVALIVIEAAALITASVCRPWMDKSTNSFNIAIYAMNFINAIFLFVFTDVFSMPGLVIGVVGVVFWIANAAFSLILLIMLIVTTSIILFHNNPDTRYQYMNDDRTSFMKSQTHLQNTSDLDALGATARASGKFFKPALDLDEDNDSTMSNPANLHNRPSPPNSTRHSRMMPSDHQASQYPADPSNEDPYLRDRASGSFRAPSPFTGSNSNLSRHSHHSINNMVGHKSPPNNTG
ncbi:Transient receptor potential (TRP) ion channel domain containing protein [Rhypophila sp. PSN 637]